MSAFIFNKMAQRRMFSLDIVSSDNFLDMPISSQCLYYHLCMYADDDGFVNPKKIMRMIGVAGDDLKILKTKRFILSFDNGVVVIKHWLINNMIRNDRYKPTRYTEEMKKLHIKENKAYTEWQPDGNQRETQIRLDKVRLDKISKDKTKEVLSEPIRAKRGELKAISEIKPSFLKG